MHHSREGGLGILSLASLKERDFSKQKHFLELLVSHIAVALQNAILYERVQQHTKELEKQITERRQIEDSLRKSEQKYRKLHENLHDGSAAMDLNGTITEFNKVFQKMEEELLIILQGYVLYRITDLILLGWEWTLPSARKQRWKLKRG